MITVVILVILVVFWSQIAGAQLTAPVSQGLIPFLGSSSGETGLWEIVKLVGIGLLVLVGIVLDLAGFKMVRRFIRGAGQGGGPLLTERQYRAAHTPRMTSAEWDSVYSARATRRSRGEERRHWSDRDPES